MANGAQPTSSSEAEGLTADGGVTKRVTREGRDDGIGGKPTEGSKCFVRYDLRLAETGEEIYSTRAGGNDAPDEVIARSEGGPAGTSGLAIGLLSMREDEACELRVRSRYAYGDKGNFSFPHVPPSADLVYSDVELVAWLAAGEEKPKTDMLFEERLGAAQRRREWGVEEFRSHRYSRAWTFFAMGLSYLDDGLLFQLEDRELGKANAIRHPLLLNGASALLRLGDTAKAVDFAEKVAKEDPSNAKAWCRAARAHRLSGSIAKANRAILEASRLDPESKAVLEESEHIQLALTAAKEMEKKRFFGIFG